MNCHDNPRAAAALITFQVIFKGRQLTRVLERRVLECTDVDRALVVELTYGVVRWFWLLEHTVNQLLHRALRRKDYDLLCLLCVGLYQLQFMRIPHYAGVSETVVATTAMGKPWARGLVNAVLRKFLKNGVLPPADLPSDVCRYAHPQWMIDRIKQEWPDCWPEILLANNQKPAMTVRVNVNRTSVADYCRQLHQVGIQADVDPRVPTALRLTERVSVEKLPGFAEGWVSVQSMASQLVARSLDLRFGQRVLDACSAPGGKLLHILEIEPRLAAVVAVEIEPTRTAMIVDNLARINHAAQIITGDASCPQEWWDGELFDRILVDAPCSALGVISKHPDIKHHRQPTDVEQVAEQQHQLLKALLPLLNSNGKLLYTTCTLLHQENDAQIERIMHEFADCNIDELPADLGDQTQFGRQRLPDGRGGDGFYYARLSCP